MAKTLLLILVLLSSSGWALGQEGRPRIIDEKLQMDLADNFFQEGDYYRAITEYKLSFFSFPKAPGPKRRSGRSPAPIFEEEGGTAPSRPPRTC